MFEFSKMIAEIDAELKPQWQPGAFAWADIHMGEGRYHANHVDRFDKAITECSARCDWVNLEKAAVVYKDDMLRLLKQYKKFKQIDEQMHLFSLLENF